MYQRILVPVDGSFTSGRGLEEAMGLAKLSGGEIRLLHVIDDLSIALAMEGYGSPATDLLPILRERGADLLEQLASTVRAAGVAVSTVQCDNLAGPVHDHVAAQQRSWDADTIVMGTHGRRGVGRALMGSSAEQVLREAAVPVLMVRAPEPQAASQVEQAPVQTPVQVVLPGAALRFEKV
mgnify:CR=1 FL=1